MSFMEHPQSDACRALMPAPDPRPPGPPSRPMVCHMPEGHDGPHALVRRPGAIDRRWEGDARPPKGDCGSPHPTLPEGNVCRESAGHDGPHMTRDGIGRPDWLWRDDDPVQAAR